MGYVPMETVGVITGEKPQNKELSQKHGYHRPLHAARTGITISARKDLPAVR